MARRRVIIPNKPAPPPPSFPPPSFPPVFPPSFGVSCFLGDTLIHMEDGSAKRLDQIKVGERIQGGFGETNTVLGIEPAILGNRSIYLVNDSFLISAEHPIWVPAKGWCSPEGDKYLDIEVNTVHTMIIDSMGNTEQMKYSHSDLEYQKSIWGTLEVKDWFSVGEYQDMDMVFSIEELTGGWPSWTRVFTLDCSLGTGAMMLGKEKFWAVAWMNPNFDYKQFIER